MTSLINRLRRFWLGGDFDDTSPVPAAPYKVDPPIVPKEILYVSPHRAKVELSSVYSFCQRQSRDYTHFMEWYTGKTAWPGPEDLFVRAFETGEATIDGWKGSGWVNDPGLRGLFEHAANKAGFTVQYRIHESDGPEADRFSLTIRPMQPK